MKIRWLAASACLLFLGTAHALTLTPQEVAPGVFAFVGDTGMRSADNEGMNANGGFIVTAQGVVVVDSGPSYGVAKRMHEAIKQVTAQPVKYVVNTGGQDHRWLGNGYFRAQGATLLASRAARADMEARGAGEIEALRPLVGEKLQGTEPVYPDRLFDGEDRLTLGGVEVQVLYFGGGHTPGDSVVWLPKARVLFSGDLVFVDRLLGVLPVSNTKAWSASFESIEKLDPKLIVPGHGRPCDLPKARSDTKDYLAALRTHMQQAVDNGVDLQSAIDTLDQSAFRHLANYELLKGGNASRTYAEMEEDSF